MKQDSEIMVQPTNAEKHMKDLDKTIEVGMDILILYFNFYRRD